jgi:hypothetical protein
VNTSQLSRDRVPSFLFCVPLPNEYLCNVLTRLMMQPIRLWRNAYLIQEAFVLLDDDQINPEGIKSSYFENFSNSLDLSSLPIQDLVVRAIQQLTYYAHSSQLDIHELPSELVLIFDKYTDINSGNVDNVSSSSRINVDELIDAVKLTLRSSNYTLNNVSVWFANTSYLPNSTKYSSDNLSLYLVQGFDDNLIEVFFFGESREFNVRDYVISKIEDLHIETVVKPYF